MVLTVLLEERRRGERDGGEKGIETGEHIHFEIIAILANERVCSNIISGIEDQLLRSVVHDFDGCHGKRIRQRRQTRKHLRKSFSRVRLWTYLENSSEMCKRKPIQPEKEHYGFQSKANNQKVRAMDDECR